MGSLSYQPRENLSLFIISIIYAIPYYIKNILGLERDFVADYWWGGTEHSL